MTRSSASPPQGGALLGTTDYAASRGATLVDSNPICRKGAKVGVVEQPEPA